MDAILRCENAAFSYPEGHGEVLHGVSLSIERGSFTAILGHNGSGKSTLAKLFNAILLPSEGKVYVDGIDTGEEDRLFDIRRRVGMVFQNPDNQIVSSVVEEDVAFAAENLGVPPEEIRRRVDDALATVGMSDYVRHAPHLLSGGQKQRIAIAGVIAMQPECIVLDEPTAMLDPAGRRDVMKTLHRLKEELGITVVLITHHMDEALQADSVVVISDGCVRMDATPAEVFCRHEELTALSLTAPESVLLLAELNRQGFDLQLDAMSPEACADAIASALQE